MIPALEAAERLYQQALAQGRVRSHIYTGAQPHNAMKREPLPKSVRIPTLKAKPKRK